MLPDAATVALTLLTLVAFASNSILTRLALGGQQIDAATYTALRIASGAVALAVILRARDGRWSALRKGSLTGASILLVYAVPYSLAYVRIGAAVGALVFFGVVQLTMVGYGVWRGDRPLPIAWAGLALATGGLVFLTRGSAVRPDPAGVLLMAGAGVAWGAYSIVGRMESDPVASNARNFLLSTPIVLLLPALAPGPVFATSRGVAAALTSGMIASGGGYIVWYRALRGLAVTQAAVAQLAVPVIAAAAAVLLLGEPMNARLVVSGVAVLGGIALVLTSRWLSSGRRLQPGRSTVR